MQGWGRGPHARTLSDNDLPCLALLLPKCPIRSRHPADDAAARAAEQSGLASPEHSREGSPRAPTSPANAARTLKGRGSWVPRTVVQAPDQPDSSLRNCGPTHTCPLRGPWSCPACTCRGLRTGQLGSLRQSWLGHHNVDVARIPNAQHGQLPWTWGSTSVQGHRSQGSLLGTQRTSFAAMWASSRPLPGAPSLS